MSETRTVVVEREIPHPPEKIWRALTRGGVLDCEVLAVEPNRTLSYTWNFAHDDPAYALQSVVTFTLTPTRTGTQLRMEQSGFRPDQKQAFGGAKAGWQQFFTKLEEILARTD